MANSESTFSDRLQRGRSLQAAAILFLPSFSPADSTLGPTTFLMFLESLTPLNTAVANAEAAWKANAVARVAIAADVRGRALRANARVKSNVAWKAQLPTVKMAANHLLGYRVPRVKSAAGSSPVVMTTPRTEQSYSDLKGLLDKLIAALTLISTYSTGAPTDITITALTTLSTQLDTTNKLVATLAATLAGARTARLAAYTAPETGLRAKMQAIKHATKSQYGSKSAQFRQIKGIKG